jgi:hypothetical protein
MLAFVAEGEFARLHLADDHGARRQQAPIADDRDVVDHDPAIGPEVAVTSQAREVMSNDVTWRA